jgi:hypothetical protein
VAHHLPQKPNLPPLAVSQPGPRPPARLLVLFAPVGSVARSPWPCINPTCRADGRLIVRGQAIVTSIDGEHAHRECAVGTVVASRDMQLMGLADTQTYRTALTGGRRTQAVA